MPGAIEMDLRQPAASAAGSQFGLSKEPASRAAKCILLNLLKRQELHRPLAVLRRVGQR
ncbi:hypothetical protein IE4803_CH00364 [Rhizobium etli bv. phaseoli str. IE4803]|nr:hypothetical protein IE4803_CH00364 [Rhizobium etli bv. phaseoli str. IE4803]